MLVACTLPNPTRRQWQKSEQLLCQHRSYATSQRRAANESTIFPVLHLAGPQVRVAVLGGGDGVAAEGVGEDEEDAGEELEVGERKPKLAQCAVYFYNEMGCTTSVLL